MDPVLSQLEVYEERLRAAMLAGDVAELDALIADDLAFVGPNGQVATKAEDLGMHGSGRVRFHALHLSDRHTRVFAGAIYTTVHAQLAVTVDGQHIEGPYRYVRVWRIEPDRWQIAGGGVSPVT